MNTHVVKVDDGLGLVFGWAVVSRVAGSPYFDSQGDFIDEPVMLRAAADFMAKSRTAREMHDGVDRGTIVFAWPLTVEIAKAFGLTTDTTGLMIAMKPDSPEVLRKFREGTYTGFSIGGRGLREEVKA